MKRWPREKIRFSRELFFKNLGKPFLERSIHREEEFSIDFQKGIKILNTWIRAWRDFGRLCLAASFGEHKYSFLVFFIVIGYCVYEFSNCIVCWVVSQLGLLSREIRHWNWGKFVIQLLYCCVAFKSAVVYCDCTVCVHLVWWELHKGVEDNFVGSRLVLVWFVCKLQLNKWKSLQVVARDWT